MAWQSPSNGEFAASRVETQIWADSAGAVRPYDQWENERPPSRDFFARHSPIRRRGDSAGDASRTASSSPQRDHRGRRSPSKSPPLLLGCFGFKTRRKDSQNSPRSSPSSEHVRRFEEQPVYESSPSWSGDDSPTPATPPPVDDPRAYFFRGKSAEVLGVMPSRAPVPIPQPVTAFSRSTSPAEGSLEHRSKEDFDDEDSFLYPSTTSSSGSTPWVKKKEGALNAARKRTRMRVVSQQLELDSIPSPSLTDRKTLAAREAKHTPRYSQDWLDDGSVLEVSEIIQPGQTNLPVQVQSSSATKEPETFAWLKLQRDAELVVAAAGPAADVPHIFGRQSVATLATLATSIESEDHVVRPAFATKVTFSREQPRVRAMMDGLALTGPQSTPTLTDVVDSGRRPQGIIEQIIPSRMIDAKMPADKVSSVVEREIPAPVDLQKDEDLIAPVFRRVPAERIDSGDTFRWMALHTDEFPLPPAAVGAKR